MLRALGYFLLGVTGFLGILHLGFFVFGSHEPLSLLAGLCSLGAAALLWFALEDTRSNSYY
jgi:hypothetical protein